MPGLSAQLLGGQVVEQAAVHRGIRRLFDGLVPTEVIDAYDELLAHDGCAKDQAEVLVSSGDLVPFLRSSLP